MPGPVIDRRHFLGSAAATAAFLAMHELPALAAQQTPAAQDEPRRPRLLSLELLTGASMSTMKAFYGKTLDLRILRRSCWADILYASEIGFIVDDVAAAAAAVKDVAAVTQYKEGDDQFVAMGDEYGLLLMMKRGRIIDFTSNADNGARVYRTGVTVRGPKVTKHQFSSHPYELTVEERCSCA